jgi:hypothetical protein
MNAAAYLKKPVNLDAFPSTIDRFCREGDTPAGARPT